MSDRLQELNSLLNDDLTNVETKRPLLKGLYELEVIEVEIRENNAKDGNSVQFTCALTAPTTAVDGRPVPAGFKVFHNISLKETPKYSQGQIKENMARAREGITGNKAGSFAPIEQYKGCKFMAQLSPKLDEEFGDKTVIARFVKRG